ncbi:MAG: BREX system ATP-binding protein BrxD, partial [Magnetococcales bacterium]|nr:BREX system ATP-binding protein BrxD [Magnetococcales bacterium]
KAVRGEYGSGKTFFARWLQEKAKKRGFATSEVQVSETETPLHRLETVYRRLVERLSTADTPKGALRQILDGWFFTLEEDVLAEGEIDEDNEERLLVKTNEMMEKRLWEITQSAPALAAALRAYRTALVAEDNATAEGLIAWISGQPNVAATIKRQAGIKGDMDHFGALSFLQGLLVILRDSGHAGLVLVLDEVETLQRVRTDVRDKGLNALRQFIDEVDSGRFPGLYLLITGTPAFYEGPQGIQRLAPLAQRLNVDFTTDARFDNPRAVQIRLPGFDLAKLGEVGRHVRDLFAHGRSASEARIRQMANDDYVHTLAQAVTGNLGGKVGIAPRIFLRKLVSDVLDRIDQFPDFNPREHYALTVTEDDLTQAEYHVLSASSVDEIELTL